MPFKASAVVVEGSVVGRVAAFAPCFDSEADVERRSPPSNRAPIVRWTAIPAGVRPADRNLYLADRPIDDIRGAGVVLMITRGPRVDGSTLVQMIKGASRARHLCRGTSKSQTSASSAVQDKRPHRFVFVGRPRRAS